MANEGRLDGASRLTEMTRAMRDRLYEDSMAACVRRYADNTPGRLCVADPDEAMTYAEMWRRACGKAGALRARGVGPGDRVLARASQRGDFLALHFAAHLLGAVFMPVSHDMPDAKMNELAKVAGAKLALTDSRMEPVLWAPESMPEPEQLATILYTTGTTGASKGIMLSHRAEVAVAQNVFYGTRMEPDTVELIPMPISHSYGLRHCFGLMLGGRSVVLADGVALAGDLFSLMDRYGVNALSMTPAAVNVLRRMSGDRLGDYAGQIRYLQLGTAGVDAAMKASLRALLPHSRLYQYYSSTEAGCACIQDFSRAADSRRVGRPAVNARFEIVDGGRPIESGPDRWGRIACLGPMNMLGYDGEPALTRQTVSGGYVISGDIGYIDGEGFLCFVGRAGDIINAGGFKVAPEEVEGAAMASGLLAECACCGEPDAILGQVPVLYAVAREGCAPDARAVREAVAERLEGFKVPRDIVYLRALPRNAIGKLQRDRCREAAREDV